MKKILTVIVASLLLGACAGNVDREFKPKTTVRVITSMSYPQFPNIEPLPPVAILPWTHDLPRDTTIVSVKNLTDCRRVKVGRDEATGKTKYKKLELFSPEDKPYVILPVEEQTTSWWRKCGENPILPNSNIFVGFSQIEWNIVIENFAKLRERIWQYRQRMIEVNRQRQEWRDKAEQERLRLTDENKEVEVKPATSTEPVKTPGKKSFLKKLFD